MKIEMNKQIKKTQIYYDGISSGYSKLYHEEQIQKINLVKNYFLTKGNILDLGCGDGVLNKFISNDVNLISFDLSFELLKLNSNKTSQNFQFSEGLGISNSLNKILGSANNLPFKKNKFDMVFAFTVIQDLPKKEIPKTILEIKKVLKEKGLLIISFLKVSSKVDLIIEKLKQNFEILEKKEEEKDFIYICEKKT